jgi:ABC-type transport system involved in multi-copper enzyme maturation permease subunit
MRGITRDCLVEMLDRKLVYVFGIVTLLTNLVVLYSGSVEINMGTGGDMGVGEINDAMGNPIMRGFSGYLSFLVFLAVLGTAGLVPSMLIRGRADYFLSKPISRSSFLLNKLFGIWIVYGATIFVCGVITYLTIIAIHGGFNWAVLYFLVFPLISLFIWLSITVFAGLTFGSQAISLMVAFSVWVLHTLVSGIRAFDEILGSKVFSYVVNVLYYVFPKNAEFSDMSMRLLDGRAVQSWMPLWSSLLFAVVLVYITLTVFKRRSY